MGIFISILIIVVSVVFECKLNREIVIVMVSLKKLEVFIMYVGVVMLCGSFICLVIR